MSDLLYHGTRELSLQAPTGERPGSCLLPHVCNPAEQSCIVFHGVVNGPGMRCCTFSPRAQTSKRGWARSTGIVEVSGMHAYSPTIRLAHSQVAACRHSRPVSHEQQPPVKRRWSLLSSIVRLGGVNNLTAPGLGDRALQPELVWTPLPSSGLHEHQNDSGGPVGGS